MIGTKYLSEAVDINNLETEKLNIIKAPTGSGKTYFALHEISSLCQNALHQAVYLIDTINGKEQILRNYNATECNKYWLRDIEGDYLWFQEDSRVVIMTYAKFGFILSTKPEFYNYFDYIICDELHSLIRFQYFSQLPNYHSIAKEGLERAVTNSKTTVIALTATPEIVKKEFNTAIYELPVSEDVRHYETTEVVRYTTAIFTVRHLLFITPGITTSCHKIIYSKQQQTANYDTCQNLYFCFVIPFVIITDILMIFF